MRRLLIALIALGSCVLVNQLLAQPPQLKPGPEHEILKQEEGSWDLTFKGDEAKGSVLCKMGLNGLWLLEHVKADFGGTPFEGHGGTTYDPTKKKYVGVWIDSMSPQPLVSEGSYDKATKTLTMRGKMLQQSGKMGPVTMTTVFQDANSKTFTMKAPGPDGSEVEMFEIRYKRRK